MEDDTIVAVSTPPGRGAIGVVRLSGPGSIDIAGTLCGRGTVLPDREAVHVPMKDRDGHLMDDAVVTWFQAPRSFTGEDVVEFSCHGSPILLDRVVSACLSLGARAARPGEFSLRAFLRGKLDLSQAEAIADLIDAPSAGASQLALQQLHGAVERAVAPLRFELLDQLAHLTALVDFSEDDVPPVARHDLTTALEDVRARLSRLISDSRQGQVLRRGVSMAIVGPPNAGKSSLLNQLLGRDRAIVSAIPGTTRDTLEEDLLLGDVLFHVVDTAGLTDSADPIESIGVGRTRAALAFVDLIVLVLDGSRVPTSADLDVARSVGTASRPAALALCLNKADLPHAWHEADVLTPAGIEAGVVVRTSALCSDGVEPLREVLPAMALQGPAPDGFVISNERHVQALRSTLDALEAAIHGSQDGLPLDIIGLDLRDAVDSLGEILGIGVGADLLDRVFTRFCIGK